LKTSESIAAIAAALALAQSTMDAARKSSNNPFFKSKYADMGAVVDAVKDALASNGISYVQFPCTNDKDEVGVETMLMHSSGEWIRSDPFYVPVTKNDAQGFGSAITYCRRYSLQAACGIAAEDDDGNAAAKAKPEKVTALPAPIPANTEGHDLLNKAEPEQRAFIDEQVALILKGYELGANMADFWDGKHYDDEEKLMLSVLLPSHVRRKIKDQQREKRAQASKPSLASQG
jgi:hypothetical protein